MNAADWIRKNLKGRVQQRLGSPARHPRLRRLALLVLGRITRSDARPAQDDAPAPDGG
ncbi:MAG: hypothetical protein H6739_07500 [Alphaproteobacteria bacterium]|nr:hypothetical protein [Alphaproteobacteria bacterium]